MSPTNICVEGESNVLVVCLGANVRKVAKIIVLILLNQVLGCGVFDTLLFVCLGKV